MAEDRFIDIGLEMAKQFFNVRDRGSNRVEVHLNEAELAALMALAAERGARDERAKAKP